MGGERPSSVAWVREAEVRGACMDGAPRCHPGVFPAVGAFQPGLEGPSWLHWGARQERGTHCGQRQPLVQRGNGPGGAGAGSELQGGLAVQTLGWRAGLRCTGGEDGPGPWPRLRDARLSGPEPQGVGTSSLQVQVTCVSGDGISPACLWAERAPLWGEPCITSICSSWVLLGTLLPSELSYRKWGRWSWIQKGCPQGGAGGWCGWGGVGPPWR